VHRLSLSLSLSLVCLLCLDRWRWRQQQQRGKQGRSYVRILTLLRTAFIATRADAAS
jgi:membrane-anchored protein YejM (alkaline phosphatase superfamily)